MAFIRMYAGEDGDSHFEELPMSLEVGEMGKTEWAGNPAILATPSYVVPEGIGRMVFASQSVLNEHPKFAQTKEPHYLITLSGEGEVEVASGDVRRLKQGDVLLLDDSSGTGHHTRIPVKPWVWIAITLKR